MVEIFRQEQKSQLQFLTVPDLRHGDVDANVGGLEAAPLIENRRIRVRIRCDRESSLGDRRLAGESPPLVRLGEIVLQEDGPALAGMRRVARDDKRDHRRRPRHPTHDASPCPARAIIAAPPSMAHFIFSFTQPPSFASLE
jgi:hypothetical protein